MEDQVFLGNVMLFCAKTSAFYNWKKRSWHIKKVLLCYLLSASFTGYEGQA